MDEGHLAPKLSWAPAEEPPALPSEAVRQLLEAAHRAFPARNDLRLEMVRHLFRLSRPLEVIEKARFALQQAHPDPEILTYLGRAAASLGNGPLALEAFRAAAENGAEVWSELGESLRREGAEDEALMVGLKRLQVAPRDFSALSLVARILLGRDERSRLWDVCERARSGGAWDGYVPSAMAHAALTETQREQVSELIDLSGWLEEASIDLKSALLAELACELDEHPRATALPLTNSTRGNGTRIDAFEADLSTVGTSALHAIQASVESYLRARAHREHHPMIRNAPARVRLRSWAISVLNDGHEDWHVHPDGWISGVLYVEVPETVRLRDRSVGKPAGAICFGALPLGQASAPDFVERRTLIPEVGKLLLFPSYLGHRTWPSRSPSARRCLAFDVVPADAPTDSKTRLA